MQYVCPKCKSHKVIPIVYGLPGPKLEQKVRKGEVMLGGCLVGGREPQLRCKNCGREWRRLELVTRQ